jgi:sec-independent protein translocase protein TatA
MLLSIISGMSTWGVLVILMAMLILFGNRLPEVARSMGRAMNEFKRGLKEVGDDIDVNDDKEPDKLNGPRNDTRTMPRSGDESASTPAHEQKSQ